MKQLLKALVIISPILMISSAFADESFQFDATSAGYQARLEGIKKSFSNLPKKKLEIDAFVIAPNGSKSFTTSEGYVSNLSIESVDGLVLKGFAALAFTKGALGHPFTFTYRLVDVHSNLPIDECSAVRVINSYNDLADYSYTLHLSGNSCSLTWKKV